MEMTLHVYEWAETEYMVAASLLNAIELAQQFWGNYNDPLDEEINWNNPKSWIQLNDNYKLSILIDNTIETQKAIEWANLNGPGPLASLYGD